MMSLRRNVKLEAEHGKALIASTSDVLLMPYDDQIHPYTQRSLQVAIARKIRLIN